MTVTIGKFAALVLAIAYVIAAWISSASLSLTLTVALGVLLPLFLIWFPEAVDTWFRLRKRGLYVKPSPAWLVVAMGWLFLVGLPLYLLLK
jgi:hypothetical protein